MLVQIGTSNLKISIAEYFFEPLRMKPLPDNKNKKILMMF